MKWNPWSAIVPLVAAVMLNPHAWAETHFLEAESFDASSNGWTARHNDQTRRASRARTLWGADGAGDAVATRTLRIEKAGRYRICVRYMQVAAWRGSFELSVATDARTLTTHIFDAEVLPDIPDWEYTWQEFEVDLPAGEVTLTLSKPDQQNCVGYVRHVDCLLVTSESSLVPDHLPYGPQTLVRVTLGDGYDRPVYLHLFADHYRSPWYAHYAIGKDGLHEALAPPTDQMLIPGEPTPWCNLTPTIYQDSGAALNLSIRHSYYEKAAHFRATLEFGRLPSDLKPDAGVEIVKTFDIEATPNGTVIIVPPNLESPENVAMLKRDVEFAESVGASSDEFDWPTYGRPPERLPMLVSASIGGYELPVDAAVTSREQRSLNRFGYNGAYDRLLHGLWFMQDNSYCRPDIEKMRERAR
ncbi:MAG: hypothetical protein KDA89_09130, partial [Planctomycetaceae bacterium]|nr:hypothetical protein [Planctomycetaceae bacterium]